MEAYSKSYLNEVVETQGELFEKVSEYKKGIDVKDFISQYMISDTRKKMDI